MKRIILDILKTKKQEQSIECIKRITDFDRFYDLSIDDGVAGLLYRKFEDSQSKIIPNQIKNKFKKIYLSNIKNYIKWESIMSEISQNIDKEIPLIIMRGPAIVEKLYKNPGVRDFSDVDILLREEEHEKFVKILKKIGFTQNVNLSNIFFRCENVIDLHLDPLNITRIRERGRLFNISEKLLKNNIERFYINKRPFFTIKKELNLILLAYHLEKHSFKRIIWLYDFHLESGNLTKKNEWARVSQYLKETNLYCPFYHVAIISIKYLDTHIPPEILEEIRLKLRYKCALISLLNNINLPDGIGPLIFSLAYDSPLTILKYLWAAFFDLSEYKNERGYGYILLAKRRFGMILKIGYCVIFSLFKYLSRDIRFLR